MGFQAAFLLASLVTGTTSSPSMRIPAHAATCSDLIRPPIPAHPATLATAPLDEFVDVSSVRFRQAVQVL